MTTIDRTAYPRVEARLTREKLDHGKDSCVILTHRCRSAESAHCAPVTPGRGCALNPSDSGLAAPSISGLFASLPEVCTNL